MAEFWFDSRSGDLLIGREAAEPRIEEAGPDILLMPPLIAARKLPIDVSGYDRLHPSRFTKEDVVALGAWALKLVEIAEGEPQPLMRRHWDRLYLLGFAPNFKSQPYFGSMGELRSELGQKRGLDYGCYDDWTVSDWQDYARSVRDSAGRKPRKQDYAAADGPGLGVIREHFGNTGKLNELIGYENFRTMSNEAYVRWGCRVAKAIGIEAFTYEWLENASKRDEAPSTVPVCRRFGTFSNFIQEVEEALTRQTNDFEMFRQQVSEGELPAHWSKLQDEQLRIIHARYQVAMVLLQDVDQAQLIARRIAGYDRIDIVDQLRCIKPAIGEAEVEESAKELGLHEVIWTEDETERQIA